jgi:hypothetical protein
MPELERDNFASTAHTVIWWLWFCVYLSSWVCNRFYAYPQYWPYIRELWPITMLIDVVGHWMWNLLTRHIRDIETLTREYSDAADAARRCVVAETARLQAAEAKLARRDARLAELVVELNNATTQRRELTMVSNSQCRELTALRERHGGGSGGTGGAGGGGGGGGELPMRFTPTSTTVASKSYSDHRVQTLKGEHERKERVLNETIAQLRASERAGAAAAAAARQTHAQLSAQKDQEIAELTARMRRCAVLRCKHSTTFCKTKRG